MGRDPKKSGKGGGGGGQSIWGVSDNGRPVERWNWDDVDSNRLAGIIELVGDRGGAIRFGYSRDGNAGSIGIYYGDERKTFYLRPGSTGEEVLGLIERTFEALESRNGRSRDA